MQWSKRFAPHQGIVRGLSTLPCAQRVKLDNGIQSLIVFVDAGKIGIEQFEGADFLFPDGARKLSCRPERHIGLDTAERWAMVFASLEHLSLQMAGH